MPKPLAVTEPTSLSTGYVGSFAGMLIDPLRRALILLNSPDEFLYFHGSY